MEEYKFNWATKKFEKEHWEYTQSYGDEYKKITKPVSFLEGVAGVAKSKWYDLVNWDYWPLIFIIGILLIIVVGSTFLVYQGRYDQCNFFAYKNNLNFIYSLNTGCLVEYNGHWVGLDNIIQLWR